MTSKTSQTLVATSTPNDFLSLQCLSIKLTLCYFTHILVQYTAIHYTLASTQFNTAYLYISLMLAHSHIKGLPFTLHSYCLSFIQILSTTVGMVLGCQAFVLYYSISASGFLRLIDSILCRKSLILHIIWRKSSAF